MSVAGDKGRFCGRQGFSGEDVGKGAEGRLGACAKTISDFSQRGCQKNPGQKYNTPRRRVGSEAGQFHFSDPIFLASPSF